MKKIAFSLMLLSLLGFASCDSDEDLKEMDAATMEKVSVVLTIFENIKNSVGVPFKGEDLGSTTNPDGSLTINSTKAGAKGGTVKVEGSFKINETSGDITMDMNMTFSNYSDIDELGKSFSIDGTAVTTVRGSASKLKTEMDAEYMLTYDGTKYDFEMDITGSFDDDGTYKMEGTITLDGEKYSMDEEADL